MQLKSLLLNKKIPTYSIATLIVILSVLAIIFLLHKPRVAAPQISTKPSIEYGYEKSVKPEDHAPIIIPNNVINKGSTLKVPILMYHHVGDLPEHADSIRKGLTVSTNEFENEMQWLHAHGYSSVSLDDLYLHINKTTSEWPKKPIIITFDDGYDDVFQNAVPILLKNGLQGSFAIITSFPGQTQGDNIYASWQEIIQAKSNGMEIICHTQNHFDGSNPKYTDDYIFKNLSGCQDSLKKYLGNTEHYLIYPFGHSTENYITQAKKVGFVLGLTVHEGTLINTEDLMHIPRVRVHPGETLMQFQKSLGA